MEAGKVHSFVLAAERGYRVDLDGTVWSPTNKVIKTHPNSHGYLYFSVGQACKCRVHRLQAWHKFGAAMLEPGLEVRHKNGNNQDNSWGNLVLGTKVENAQDKTPETRMRTALNAARHAQRHNHEEIIALHLQGLSYKQISERLGITSKGTISFVIRKSMAGKARS